MFYNRLLGKRDNSAHKIYSGRPILCINICNLFHEGVRG